MRVIITIVLYGAIAYGVFYLGSTVLTKYGEDMYRRGYRDGEEFQKVRCWNAHGEMLKGLISEQDKRDVAWTEHKRRKK